MHTNLHQLFLWSLLLLFGTIGIWTQGLRHARQALYCLSHSTSPVSCSYMSNHLSSLWFFSCLICYNVFFRIHVIETIVIFYFSLNIDNIVFLWGRGTKHWTWGFVLARQALYCLNYGSSPFLFWLFLR
jgi:hypothetical protein